MLLRKRKIKFSIYSKSIFVTIIHRTGAVMRRKIGKTVVYTALHPLTGQPHRVEPDVTFTGKRAYRGEIFLA